VERRIYPTEPDVQVLVETQRPEGKPAGEVVLVHGLEGSSASGYMKSAARAVLEAGFTAHRFNLRSCGGTEPLARTGYHSGLTCDLLAFLQRLRADAQAPIYVIGFSLGGNVVLKLAGELGGEARGWLGGVCAVSTPIDLAACVDRLDHHSNYLYQQRFVRRLKRRIRRLNPGIRGLDAVRTVRDFDDRITAPAFGFRDADHYYATQSCWQFLDGIRVPALLIQAKDDPVIPFEIFKRPGLLRNPCIRLLAVERGGHVGFLSLRRPRFWLGPVLVEWMHSCPTKP
jgi:predicted alpha/beta-fold hydrolase